MSIKVIAEIGINHDGDYLKAKKLIDESCNSKVWGIKFQYRNLERSYHNYSKEIGDESLKHEIKKVFIPPIKIIELSKYAKSLGLKVGISFFIKEDALDFKNYLNDFDFFKVPSVELSNLELLDFLLSKDKLVLMSTGCHTEEEIIKVIDHIKLRSNWIMLHCVSNYPLANYNSKLGFIKRLEMLCGKKVGYSSHDQNWELCLLAAKEGASIIERHITLNKLSKGLDHSTSSTPEEFKKLSEILYDWQDIYKGNIERTLNQGELLNKQNLGRSLVSKRKYIVGEVVDKDQLDYRSPKIGLDLLDLNSIIDKSLKKPLNKGEVLQKSHFEDDIKLSSKEIENCIKKKISLPVRIHDAQEIQREFPIKNFEFHLSYNEVLGDFDYSLIKKENQYSIHLPDYIDSVTLIDPFSSDPYQLELSDKIISRCKKIGEKIFNITSKEVIIVGSFSICNFKKIEFYKKLQIYLAKISNDKVIFVPQWLPPIAWYFGGSILLDVFNDDIGVNFIREQKFPICLDISHLFMCKKNLDFNRSFQILKDNSKHIHIADAKGIDGEGIEIGAGDEENLIYIQKLLESNSQKVIEVWQGHLDNFYGFRKAIKTISSLIEI